jgi:hypothetical protein
MPHLRMAIALPFVVNLPDERYTVLLGNGRQHILELSNQMWVLRTQTEFAEGLALPAPFGTQIELEQRIRDGSVGKYTTEKLGTWLQEDFPLAPDADRDAASDLASREHEGFLAAVNSLIEAYRVVRRDPFAHPVSRTRCLVYRWADFGKGQVQLSTRIGKVPHFLRQPWMPGASADVRRELADVLGGAKHIPFHRMQLIQARAHVEWGQTRAAIMEARGAFENAIAAKITECLSASGSNDTQIEAWLGKHDKFDQREAKLTQLTGKSLIAADKALNDSLMHWRETVRNTVIHASLVPTLSDAENACTDHERAVDWIDSLTYQP